MKGILSALLFFGITVLHAQYLTLETGGTGLYCPSLSFDYLLKDNAELNSNGAKFKVGVGYWNGEMSFGVVKLGLFSTWGKINTIEAGLEIGWPFGEMSSDFDGWLLHPCVNYRFGKGYIRGLVGLGPLILPFRNELIFSPYLVMPMATVGVSYRLFKQKN